MAGSATITASKVLELPDPLPLDGGQRLEGVRIAYEAYGTLNAARDNAIFVAHATTGDQHVASPHPITGKPGWWDRSVGPGKPIDTDRFYVLCANVIGGCMGSTGPSSIAPVSPMNIFAGCQLCSRNPSAIPHVATVTRLAVVERTSSCS